MESITFTNSIGESIELGGERPFILTKVEGAGAVRADLQTEKSHGQDGVSYIGNTLQGRSLSIEIMIIASDERVMVNERRRLARAFNPKLGKGKIIYRLGDTERAIEAIPELAPTFPHGGDFQETMQPALVQLFCHSPFWADIEETRQEITTWQGGLTFPLVLPDFFAVKTGKEVNIYNAGDVPAPVTVEFRGPATNPRIINHTIGRYIQVNRAMSEGENLIITTHFGNKRVEINGQNVFNWIDLDSTFWQLQPGDNLIEYTSDDGIEPAVVRVGYKNLYVGV